MNNCRRTWSLHKFAFIIVTALSLIIGTLVPSPLAAQASQDDGRKIKKDVPAVYPELARKNNIHGIVRLQIVVTPEGKVKDTKVLGGNPVLVDAFIQAVLKREYEPAPRTSTIVVVGEFK